METPKWCIFYTFYICTYVAHGSWCIRWMFLEPWMIPGNFCEGYCTVTSLYRGSKWEFQTTAGMLETKQQASRPGGGNCALCSAVHRWFQTKFERIRECVWKLQTVILIYPWFKACRHQLCQYESSYDSEKNRLTTHPIIQWCLFLRRFYCRLKRHFIDYPSQKLQIVLRIYASTDFSFGCTSIGHP